MDRNLTTLCYIEKNDRYLMLHRVKKEHDINKDKWIGIGGHLEENETPEEFMSDQFHTEYMFLYTSRSFCGELADCDEGVLEWVDKKAVYQLPIWKGDKIFFKLLDTSSDFFSLKLRYEGEELAEAILNGKEDMLSIVS